MGKKNMGKKRHSIKGIFRKIIDLTVAYKFWIWKKEKRKKFFINNSGHKKLEFFPLISIIMPVYNIKKEILAEAIESVRNQIYTNWELCIADDCSTWPDVKETLKHYSVCDNRIHVIFREENGHISKATNSALQIAKGDYICFMDDDDILEEEAIYEYVKILNQKPEMDFFYCDEDFIDEKGRRKHPFFKMNWNEKLLYSHNYITHFVMISKKIINDIGMLDVDLNGSQDYDYVLRATAKASNICHVPKVLYHWRAIEGSVAENPESKKYAYSAGAKALQKALKQKERKGDVSIGLHYGTYKINYLTNNKPKVSIIWINSKKNNSIEQYISETKKLTDYDNYEILIFHTFSDAKKIKDCANYIIDFGSVMTVKNQSINYATGEYLVFIENDFVPVNKEWLKELLNEGILQENGMVGGKKLDKHFHTFGKGIGIHPHNKRLFFPQKGMSNNNLGDYYQLSLPHFVFAIESDFFLIKKELFEKVKGFSEDLTEICSSVDLCLKIRSESKEIVWTPYAVGKKPHSLYWQKRKKDYDDLLQKWPQNNLIDQYANLNCYR